MGTSDVSPTLEMEDSIYEVGYLWGSMGKMQKGKVRASKGSEDQRSWDGYTAHMTQPAVPLPPQPYFLHRDEDRGCSFINFKDTAVRCQRNYERDRSGGRSDDGWEAPRVEILRGLIAAKIGIVDSQFCIKLTTSQKASQTIVSSFIDTDEATLTHSPTSVFPHTKHYRHHQMRTHSSLTQAIIPQLILRKLQIRRRYTMNDSNNDISTC